MLFDICGGLQVLPIGKDIIEANWKYVQSQTGCAIISLGDSMVKWTNGFGKRHAPSNVCPWKPSGIGWMVAGGFDHPTTKSSMKRLEGSVQIPPLEEGVVTEDKIAEDWLASDSTKHKREAMNDFEEIAGKEPGHVGDELMPFE